jgi:hypothetical protein
MADGRVSLPFLRSKNVNRAIIVRSAIVACIEGIRIIEKESKEKVSQGRQTAKQAATTEGKHRAQVQRLAQLGNEHGQLCYNFEHREFLLEETKALEDPTCRRALRLCFEELDTLQLPSEFIHPEVHHPDVEYLVTRWFSPAFTLSKDQFYEQLWLRSRLPELAKSGKYIDPRAWNYAPAPTDANSNSTDASTIVTSTSTRGQWKLDDDDAGTSASTTANSYHNASKWELGDADTVASAARSSRLS